MIPFDFLQVRARGGLGKKYLPDGPGPQGSADPLETQGRLWESHPGRRHLEPAGLQVLKEGQAPQAKGDTGQMDKAQDGQRGRTLVVPQAEMLFQIPYRQLNGMITNDKFCCTRWGELHLSWWRRPLRLRS